MKTSFRNMLAERQCRIHSLLCVGLDPNPEKLPDPFKESFWTLVPMAVKIFLWMKGIVDATNEYASMFKPQSAYWESVFGGRLALQILVLYIHRKYPDIPVFLDCKRGDIDRTQARYREAHFFLDGVDGMNFSPYMGSSCMKNLVGKNYVGQAIVGLCYTSNPEAREIQDLKLEDGRKLWEVIAEKTLKWSQEFGIFANAGLVMAAAYEFPKKSGNIVSDFLGKCREIVGDKLWFLIPGVGTQGGFIEETVRMAYMGHGSIAINSSSGISEASSDEYYKAAAKEEAEKLAKQMWSEVEKMSA